MRRVIVPALLAVAMVAMSSANASAFGLFDKLCNKGGCDTCCDVDPACGCEAPCAPTCGCEVADPCCGDPCAKQKKCGLFSRLFSKHRSGCDTGCCEPACGCEAACEPACGCEAACEPACGCEAPCAPSCGCEADPCCGQSKPGCKIKGMFSRLFSKRNRGCDSGCDNGCCSEPACGCEPTCGCEAACEPTCGCEPSCGYGN